MVAMCNLCNHFLRFSQFILKNDIFDCVVTIDYANNNQLFITILTNSNGVKLAELIFLNLK